ncbi:MAG: chromosome segregation protein SMC [Candidimonas sp.]|nr:MAG: chromosome segregation protein SMC [Candidimonas sp.]
MNNAVFIYRVVLRNYRSIGYCDVRLGPLTYLVGANGAGKSNFVDGLHLVSDALNGSLDNALQVRGGLNEVRRRSSGHPTNFAIRLEFRLPDGRPGHFTFEVGAHRGGGYEVKAEECVIQGIGKGPYYRIERGELKDSSEATFPAVLSDRLALVAASGVPVFRPVFDALASMGFYNLNPKLMRELQKPQEGRLLKSAGENVASVVAHLERVGDDQMSIITEYLRTVVPMVHGVEHKVIGPMATLEFRQEMAGAKHPWRFLAQNMSDGTLRALGILVALFQGNRDYAPTLIGIEEPETALHPAASAALRDALGRAAQKTQVVVTSHSPELLDDQEIDTDAVLAVVSEGGETYVASLDGASRKVLRQRLFSVGELLRLNQLEPDRRAIEAQQRQSELFGNVL